MSVIINILAGSLLAIGGGILLYKKMPAIKEELAIRQELGRIEREAYLTESIIVAEQRGIQKAREGLLPNILAQRKQTSNTAISKLSGLSLNLPKEKAKVIKIIKKQTPKAKIVGDIAQEEQPKQEFPNMREPITGKK